MKSDILQCLLAVGNLSFCHHLIFVFVHTGQKSNMLQNNVDTAIFCLWCFVYSVTM